MYISDGDTIAVKKTENGKVTGKLIKVRLFGIDAPELKQDYGYESKQALMNFIKNKDVKIEGRLIGVIYFNNENINEKMVKTGNAWWYEQYDRKNLKMKQYQENARKSRIGLFAKKGYVTPWEFRKRKKR